MDTRWLEAFLAVAEELHFARAAERLHMGHSPLSQTIRKLEREVGADLFVRSTRSVALTSAGHAFVPHARKVLEDLRSGRAAVRSGGRRVYGDVTIAFSGALNHQTVPPLTRAVRRRHPDIAVRFVDRALSGEALTRLEQGTVDLAFVGLPFSSPSLDHLLITVETNHLIVPSEHRLADRRSVHPAELADEAFVCTPREQGSSMRNALTHGAYAAGFVPVVAQEVLDPYLILPLVAAGVGVAVVPECFSSILPEGVVEIPLEGRYPPLRSAIAWSRDNEAEPLRAVLALAREVFPEPAAD
ncbi:LysR family transcriptional regulator [Kocuria sp. CPCC 205263]|uniref:LysR family transcriptional regulator n=1 Tax=Kocuria sp. CPCC 205263 TaxID=3073555 RepID=UPI0034D62EA5